MEDNDSKLVINYLDGDNQAFQNLVLRHLKAVYNLAHHLTGNEEWAKDIAQETFLKAWRNLRKYDHSKKFSSWILTIAKNTSLDWLRKRKVVFFSELDNEAENNFFEERLESVDPLPEEIFIEKETNESLDKALYSLQPFYRAIIILHLNYEKTFEEIAEIMGKPMNTIKSQYRRALVQLKKYLHQNPI